MRNFIFSLLTFLLLPAYLHAQSIKGQIQDSKGVGIPGAIVVASTSNTSTDADFDGNFAIKAKEGESLKISMLGFNSITVKASSGFMKITLYESDDTVLKDVIVIGYGTRKKIDNTTAISSIKSEEITKTKVLNASQAIQGKRRVFRLFHQIYQEVLLLL